MGSVLARERPRPRARRAARPAAGADRRHGGASRRVARRRHVRGGERRGCGHVPAHRSGSRRLRAHRRDAAPIRSPTSPPTGWSGSTPSAPTRTRRAHQLVPVRVRPRRAALRPSGRARPVRAPLRRAQLGGPGRPPRRARIARHRAGTGAVRDRGQGRAQRRARAARRSPRRRRAHDRRAPRLRAPTSAATTSRGRTAWCAPTCSTSPPVARATSSASCSTA